MPKARKEILTLEKSFGYKNVVLSLHPTRLTSQHPMFEHAHNVYELTYVFHGTLHQVICNRHIVQENNSLVLLNINTKHRVWIQNDGDIAINILVRRSFMEDLFMYSDSQNTILSDFLNGKSHDAYMYFPSSSKMAAIIDNMITEHYYQKELSDPLQQALFVQLLTYGVRKTYHNLPKPIDDNDIHHDVMTIIENQFATISMSQLAKYFSYSYRHMERLVHHIYGMSFPTVVNLMKIQTVHELLADGFPLCDAAESAGFSDPSYYKKVLRRLDHLSPNLKRHQKAQDEIYETVQRQEYTI